MIRTIGKNTFVNANLKLIIFIQIRFGKIKFFEHSFFLFELILIQRMITSCIDIL
jgi:hypothetical protein